MVENELTKICTKCGKIKSILSFYNDKQKKDGKSSHCKECELKIQRLYKKTHPKRYWARRTLSDHRSTGYNVLLTLDELYNNIINIEYCKLCGCKLDWSRYTKGGSPNSNSPSLDRVNNENYIDDKNFVVICHECNITKGKRTMKEFIDYCKKLSLLGGD